MPTQDVQRFIHVFFSTLTLRGRCRAFNSFHLINQAGPQVPLITFITAPAHPHATWIAVYLVLFKQKSYF